MAKTASEKLSARKEPRKVVLDKNFAGIHAGQRMLVGTPQMIDQYIRKIPSGETRTVPRLRNELARRHTCNAMCPVSTAIFIRIVAEAAIEALESGAEPNEISPFWRVVGPDDKIAKKLSVDREWIRHRRDADR